MTISRILVPLRGDGRGEYVLAHAAKLAHRYNAHIEAVHCRARAEDYLPIGINVPAMLRDQIRSAADTLAAEEEAALRDRFAGLLPALGLKMTDPADLAPREPSAHFEEAKGKMVDVIRARGRLADFVAVAQPDRDRNLGENSLRTALFQTARPALMCPPAEPPADFGAHIAIAWNGALEATRAVALAQPILRMTDRITVLDGGADHPRISGEALLQYLSGHEVSAEIVEIDARNDPGAAILKGAREVGATMILAGAYGHSRQHEMIFGGATQTIIDDADLAVLMAH
ncbi:MAG: universal stress protein [Pseudomonadota bacterium]